VRHIAHTLGYMDFAPLVHNEMAVGS